MGRMMGAMMGDSMGYRQMLDRDREIGGCSFPWF